MLSRMKVSAAAVSVQRKFGQMPSSDQYLKPQLAGRVQMNDGTQQWMPISKQNTLFFSDKNDKDDYLVKLDVPQIRLNKYNKGICESQNILMDQKNENSIDEKALD